MNWLLALIGRKLGFTTYPPEILEGIQAAIEEELLGLETERA